MGHTYVLIQSGDVTEEMISAAIQDGVGTLRKSLDDSLVVLKFDGSPVCFDGCTTYSREQILAVMGSAAWTLDDE